MRNGQDRRPRREFVSIQTVERDARELPESVSSLGSNMIQPILALHQWVRSNTKEPAVTTRDDVADNSWPVRELPLGLASR